MMEAENRHDTESFDRKVLERLEKILGEFPPGYTMTGVGMVSVEGARDYLKCPGTNSHSPWFIDHLLTAIECLVREWPRYAVFTASFDHGEKTGVNPELFSLLLCHDEDQAKSEYFSAKCDFLKGSRLGEDLEWDDQSDRPPENEIVIDEEHPLKLERFDGLSMATTGMAVAMKLDKGSWPCGGVFDDDDQWAPRYEMKEEKDDNRSKDQEKPAHRG